MYLFLSSDAHSLFKKGMLHTLSYPEGYCDHFRYDLAEDIPAEIKNNPQALKSKEGVVVYVKGNDLRFQPSDREVEFITIRKVTVKEIKVEWNTGLLHVFLELGPFVAFKVGNYLEQPNKLPPTFIFKARNVQSVEVRWRNKIDELIGFDKSFKNALFFRLRFLSGSGRELIKAKFNHDEHTSYYLIKEQKRYLVDISLYNTITEKQQYDSYELSLTNNHEDLVFSNLAKIVTGTDKDDRTILFSTKVLKSIVTSGSLIFHSRQNQEVESTAARNDYEVDIRINACKTFQSILLYATLASLALVAVFLVTYSIAILKDGKFIPWVLLSSAIVCSIISSSGFFYFFNKN